MRASSDPGFDTTRAEPRRIHPAKRPGVIRSGRPNVATSTARAMTGTPCCGYCCAPCLPGMREVPPRCNGAWRRSSSLERRTSKWRNRPASSKPSVISATDNPGVPLR